MLKKTLLAIVFLLLPLSVLAADLDISIAKNRLAWNQWQFDAPGTLPDYLFLWDFGDGQLAEVKNPVHSFAKSGAYKVTLSVSDGRGEVDKTEILLRVGFWNIHNLKLQILLAVLTLCTVGFALSLIFNVQLPFKLGRD